MKIWTIAKLGFRESIRQRTIYCIFILALLFIFLGKGCNPGKIKGEDIFFDKIEKQNIVITIAFHGVAFWSMMLCGLLAASALPKEIEDGTALLTLCRPVRRESFIAGKMLSVLLISSLNLFLLSLIFSVIFYSDFGFFNFRLLFSLAFMVTGQILYILMNCFFSLFIPRIVTPLVGILIYLTTCWSSLPFYFDRLRIVWSPSNTIKNIHEFFPCFGDIQFVSAEFIKGMPSLDLITAPVVNILIYCTLFWFLTVFLFKKSQK